MRKCMLTLSIAAFFTLFSLTAINARASDGDGLQKIRATCYCHAGITASGQYTREGIVAGKKDWMGKAVALYSCGEGDELGEFIGYFEVLDTGAGIDTDGDGRGDTIKNGKSIDIYKYTLDDAKAFVKEHGDYVYMKLIDAEG